MFLHDFLMQKLSVVRLVSSPSWPELPQILTITKLRPLHQFYGMDGSITKFCRDVI